ncbi:hypothetical protein EV216_1397 [Rhodovulum steppense]|uniref:Uncharacterized protein n=1 Tax=Rhodovulum steppense TaxID=540251 RepID=A0A4R1YH10_9RHOB|nr:hypothetical protein EV216_1397 [Rhodovulum steppense]
MLIGSAEGVLDLEHEISNNMQMAPASGIAVTLK